MTSANDMNNDLYTEKTGRQLKNSQYDWHGRHAASKRAQNRGGGGGRKVKRKYEN